MTAVGW